MTSKTTNGHRPYPTMANKSKYRLKDATAPLLFTVEKQHAKGSIVGDPENCAGACALKSIPGIKYAWVKRSTTIIEFEDGSLIRYRNPSAMQKAVEGFDLSAGIFPPGVYKLIPFSPSQRIGAMNGLPRTWTSKGRKKPVHVLR